MANGCPPPGLASENGALRCAGNSLGINGHLLHKWQHDLATGPVILDIVQDLIGPNFFIWRVRHLTRRCRRRAQLYLLVCVPLANTPKLARGALRLRMPCTPHAVSFH